jgi:hypothetical protein
MNQFCLCQWGRHEDRHDRRSDPDDFMHPDRVVIGCEAPKARDILREAYRPLYLRETPIVMTTLESSELTKYAANAFLAAKITFINEIADLCEKLGGDIHDVATGLDLERVGALMADRVFVDLRNVYRPDIVRAHGFTYTSIGRV